MENIVIPFSKEDSFLEQIKLLYQTLKNLSKKKQVFFDLRALSFSSPVFLLPLALYIQQTKSNYQKPINKNVRRYLEIISFPTGISAKHISKTTTYLPISILSPIQTSTDLILSFLEKHLALPTLSKKAQTDLLNVYNYLITEHINNIFEHSQTQKGYILSKFYPKKNSVEICILDTGIGLVQSYRNHFHSHITEEKAIRNAVKGVSTKNQQERGYGIPSTMKIILEGFKGDFLLISEHTALINQKITQLKDFYWKGTLLAYRIPTCPPPINVYDFVEYKEPAS